jgi:Domain of unknown function (DUF4388)
MVALQGTLDTFALADVLRLLASTKKTGRLRVTGDRGSGSVWVDDGRIVSTELAVPGTSDDKPATTLFNLLRFARGSFTFESGATALNAGTPLDVEPLIGQAEYMLDEWRAIEAVVPSLEAWLTLRAELANDVMIDSARWRVIAAVAGGAAAGAVGDALGLNEMSVLRAAKELVELGLLDVGEAPAGFGTKDPNPFPVAAPAPLRARIELHDDPAPPTFAELRDLGTMGLSDEPISSLAPPIEDDRPEPAVSAPAMSLAPPPVAPTPPSAAIPAPPTEPPLDDAAEIARQLANLSPRAAKAVAAAAKANTDEEREAALAAIEAEDDTVNRGLLLRFLGSVDR